MIQQQDLLAKLAPIFKEKGNLFQKKSKVKARKARLGERIQTQTSDGLETENIAQKDDMLVENQTDSKERYLVPKSGFLEKYFEELPIDDEWSWYQPIGIIIAIEVNEHLLSILNVNDPFYFVAPWKEKMIARLGDYLVCPRDFSEIYRIAKKEFETTYRPFAD